MTESVPNMFFAKKEPINVLFYARVSSRLEDANGEENDCYQDQEIVRQRLFYAYHRPIKMQVVKAGHDRESRTAAFKEVRERLQTGPCRIIAVMSLDRIGRGAEIFEFLALANEFKARVIAPDDELDTRDTDWRLIAMYAAMKQGFYGDGE